MYGKLKVHKEKITYRPIVDNTLKFAKPLEQYLLKRLNKIAENTNKYTVKNTDEVLERMKEMYEIKKDTQAAEMEIPKGHRIRSVDFTSMYTNVPTEKVIKIIESKWDEQFKDKESMEYKMTGKTAAKAVKLFLTKGGFFTANNILYKQNKGLMMGAALSAVVAAIIIEDAMQKISRNIPEKVLITIYADDILYIGDDKNYGRMLGAFDTEIPEMPYTEEEEACETDAQRHKIYKLRYLEIEIRRTIRKRTGKIQTIWGKKPYDSNRMLNYHSYHMMTTKRSLLRNSLRKAVAYTSIELITEALDKWIEIAKQNEYPETLAITTASEHITDKMKATGTEERKLWKVANRHMQEQQRKGKAMTRNNNKRKRRNSICATGEQAEQQRKKQRRNSTTMQKKDQSA